MKYFCKRKRLGPIIITIEHSVFDEIVFKFIYLTRAKRELIKTIAATKAKRAE